MLAVVYRDFLVEFCAGPAPRTPIADADGTYPVRELPKLIYRAKEFDMIVGVRTGSVSEIPRLRRFPKRMLTIFAPYIAKAKIVIGQTASLYSSKRAGEVFLETEK